MDDINPRGKLVGLESVLSRFNPHTQKLLFQLIANLDQRSELLKVRVTLEDFVAAVGRDRDGVTFSMFAEAAKELMGKCVVIKSPRVPGEKRPGQLICHLVSSHEANPNDNSIAFSFDPALKPYLLKLKQDPDSYLFIVALDFESSYAIRLYDTLRAFRFRDRPTPSPFPIFAKYWERASLMAQGTSSAKNCNATTISNVSLSKPAVREINAKSEVLISLEEIKKPGTKTVEKLVFELHPKERIASQTDL
jgi:plasmid replication initiation protein